MCGRERRTGIRQRSALLLGILLWCNEADDLDLRTSAISRSQGHCTGTSALD